MAKVLLTNVVGCIRFMHAFLPLLEKSEGPRIGNVSSRLGSPRSNHLLYRDGDEEQT
ncbi:hypothetical protein ABZ769_26855 [Streptomyces olivoreticuli]